MLKDLEKHSSRSAKHTIVIDAGIAGEDNLAAINAKGYKYVCVSRKRIKDYPREVLTTENIQLTDRGKNKVKLSVFQPEGYPDTWMYVESEGKREKEESMNKKLRERFEEDMESIRSSLSKKGGTKQIDKVWERIGRVKERHNRVSGRYEIIVEKEDQKATALRWRVKPDKVKDDKSKGVYFIRTNYTKPTEKELWDIYNTIRGVESTFRSLKSDLNIRPIYHQKDDRIDAHLYLTMLAYQLVNTIRYMLKKSNINYSWSTIRRIMSTQKIQTVVLRTDKKEIHLRKPSDPIAEVKEIYAASNCKATQPAVKKYVVYH
jgi:transposase